MADSAITDAAETLLPAGNGPFIFTCEHASNRLVGVEADDSDRHLLDDHWGWDIGAADVVRALATRHACPAVLSRFSRLIIDPNRDLLEETLIPVSTHDGPVSFNQDLTPQARQDRIDSLWSGYHHAVDEAVTERLGHGQVHLVSVHSFTPVWLGHARPMEIGVLFDEYHEHAMHLAGALGEQGFEVSLNEPYTGKSGLIYSIARHGRRHEVPFMELEIRNDLIDTPDKADDVAARLWRALDVFTP